MVVGALGLGKMDCEKLEKLNMIIDHESNYDCDPVKPKKKSWTCLLYTSDAADDTR